MVDLPEDAVFSRLGRNRFLSNISATEQSRIKLLMLRGFAQIRPRGCWKLLKIAERDPEKVVLSNGVELISRAFAEFVGNAPLLWLGGVTVGSGIERLIAQDHSVMSENVVFDAVGSECADNAMKNLQQLAALELMRNNLAMGRMRFSPGYGKLDLSVQKHIFELLPMQSALNVTLSNTFIMQPEKSVTAFTVVNKLT